MGVHSTLGAESLSITQAWVWEDFHNLGGSMEDELDLALEVEVEKLKMDQIISEKTAQIYLSDIRRKLNEESAKKDSKS